VHVAARCGFAHAGQTGLGGRWRRWRRWGGGGRGLDGLGAVSHMIPRGARRLAMRMPGVVHGAVRIGCRRSLWAAMGP